MSIPVLTFFNNKGGVGKTSLAYHVAWMLPRIGHKTLVCDLDPQANLTSAFLDEDRLERLWNEKGSTDSGATIFECVKPLTEVGDVLPPRLHRVSSELSLLPGDLALSGFEDLLSREWPDALGSDNLHRPFRILSAFWTVMQAGAQACEATVVLADVGPNLGAINRSALIATDKVVVPLGADLFSLQGLRNLGPTLRNWRRDWGKRRENWRENGPSAKFPLPDGTMEPTGYIVQQHGVRMNRPVKAYDKWVNRIPEEYARTLLDRNNGPFSAKPAEDEHCLATLRHYRSLVPMSQEQRKPIFHLTPADGAIGGHSAAVNKAYCDYKQLAQDLAHIAQPSTSDD